MNEFNYYFNGVRHTETDLDFLSELTKNMDNSYEVIEGIIESKKRWDDSQVLTSERLAATVRTKRDLLLAEIEPQLLRFERQERLGIETNDTEAWYLAALQYAQDLRDVPQQEGFPTDIVWPETTIEGTLLS